MGLIGRCTAALCHKLGQVSPTGLRSIQNYLSIVITNIAVIEHQSFTADKNCPEKVHVWKYKYLWKYKYPHFQFKFSLSPICLQSVKLITKPANLTQIYFSFQKIHFWKTYFKCLTILNFKQIVWFHFFGTLYNLSSKIVNISIE